MSKYYQWLAGALVAATLAACGGGGGGGDGGGGGGGGAPTAPGPAAAPPVTGTPTAVLDNTQQGAASLAAAVNAGAAALDKVDGFSTLPLGVEVSPPTAVTTTDTVACSGGGTVVGTFNVANANTVSPGDTARLVLANCVEFGIGSSGTIDMAFTRFIDEYNFTASFTVTSLVVTQDGQSRGPSSFAGQVDYAHGTANLSYVVDGVSVLGSPSMTRNGNNVLVANGVTRNNLGAGFVELAYSGWAFDHGNGRPSAGLVHVTAANGQSASVSVGTNGYQVVVNANGTATTYVVPF